MGARKTIIIVDDEPDIAQSIAQVLAAALPDMQVVATQSPQEALLHAKDGINLLVTDFRMPVMNGLELARRALSFHGDLPIIIVTAYRDSDLQEAAAALGIDVIQKPLEPLKFINAVEATLAAV